MSCKRISHTLAGGNWLIIPALGLAGLRFKYITKNVGTLCWVADSSIPNLSNTYVLEWRTVNFTAKSDEISPAKVTISDDAQRTFRHRSKHVLCHTGLKAGQAGWTIEFKRMRQWAVAFLLKMFSDLCFEILIRCNVQPGIHQFFIPWHTTMASNNWNIVELAKIVFIGSVNLKFQCGIQSKNYGVESGSNTNINPKNSQLNG